MIEYISEGYVLCRPKGGLCSNRSEHMLSKYREVTADCKNIGTRENHVISYQSWNGNDKNMKNTI